MRCSSKSVAVCTRNIAIHLRARQIYFFLYRIWKSDNIMGESVGFCVVDALWSVGLYQVFFAPVPVEKQVVPCCCETEIDCFYIDTIGTPVNRAAHVRVPTGNLWREGCIDDSGKGAFNGKLRKRGVVCGVLAAVVFYFISKTRVCCDHIIAILMSVPYLLVSVLVTELRRWWVRLPPCSQDTYLPDFLITWIFFFFWLVSIFGSIICLIRTCRAPVC